MTADQCDALIIGAGIAGVSIAAELAPHCRVLVVEAEPTFAYHASGRSAAIYLPDYGGPVVRALSVASRCLFDELSDEHGSPLLTERALLAIADDDPSEAALESIADEMKLQPLSNVEATRLCPVLRRDRIRSAGLYPDGRDIDVAGVHASYVRRIKASHGRLVNRAPVHALTRGKHGWRVAAGDDVISADFVVNAAGAWADQVAHMAGVPTIGLKPMLRSAFISPTSQCGNTARRWPFVYNASNRWYFRPEGNAVLVSPADETVSIPCDARPNELEIARAIDDVNATTTLGLRSVSHSWAGLRSFVADGEPVAGPVDVTHRFHYFAGQGGYGFQMAPALAKAGAAAVLGQELTAPLPERGVTASQLSPARLSLT